ncbi:MAG: molybdopterin molybdenumtransferase MoeA [Pedosphaera sp.]|nr:molybdopterin molybdenumtransferase MoeA [Pedosphaera sp.]
MRTLEEARNRLLADLPRLPVEFVPLQAANGRFIASEIVATIDLPPFDNSAMDGYAVRAEDTQGAGSEQPVRLLRIGAVAAGNIFTGRASAGDCVRVFTGSPLPAGTDCVIMQEDVEATESGILVRAAVKPWEFVRFRGEDVKAGTKVLAEGTRIGPAAIGLLAALGLAGVNVRREPRVAIIATGSELQPAGTVLEPGKLYESNSLMLEALLRATGAQITQRLWVPDDPRMLAEALAEALAAADLVVTAGGASVGEHDLVRSVFVGLGGSIEFWRIAMKPGKPFFYGRLGERILLGVPGNPVSAFVTTLLLVLPTLLAVQGAADPLPPDSAGVLAEAILNPDSRRHFVRVNLCRASLVHLAGVQASHALSPLAAATGLVDVPPRTTLSAGSAIRVIRIPGC